MTAARYELVWSDLAFQRLVDIRDALAEKDPRAADTLLRALIARAEQLADFPALGRVVPELPGSEFRELIEKQYRIVYRVRRNVVEVATVFEGYREFPMGDVSG